MSKRRPPNEIESKLHQAILSRPNKRVTLKQIEGIIPEPINRKNALNFLLGVGLLISVDKPSTFRAVTHEEFTQSRDLGEEENTILRLIRASKDEGIWTKHIKSKTNLHKPVIENCLRSLTAKKLIKRVSSVQHTTRKIYMLEGITPSVTLTGGPWYTDNELDTQFIRHLTEACLKIIRTLSFPKRMTESTQDALYAPSNAPEYPSASHICTSLKNAQLTDTELSVDDVMKLLDILILDGEIERIPVLGQYVRDSDDETMGNQLERSSRKKRKRASSHDEDPSTFTGRSRTEGVEEESTLRTNLKINSRQIARDTLEFPDVNNASLVPGTGKILKGAAAASTNNSSGGSDHRPDLRSGLYFQRLNSSKSEDFLYRAINPERPLLGWLGSPCNYCSAFEFCKAGGPINPSDCLYFRNWMGNMASSELF